MATSTPFPFRDHLAIRSAVTDEQIETIIEWYEANLGDADKASDIEDARYYTAISDGYGDVLRLLLGITEQQWQTYHGLPVTKPDKESV